MSLYATDNRDFYGIGTAVKQSYLEWVSQEDRERQEKYRSYREYYDGDQGVSITDRQEEFLELDSNQEFSANYCSLVADQLPNRMSVAGFDAPGELGGRDGILWKWWRKARKARMDAKQQSVHLSGVRDGDTFLIVSWDPSRNRPIFAPNLAFDGYEGVKVHYSDETGEIVMASKRWNVKIGQEEDGSRVGERRRMNLYYPDRVERYISDDTISGGAWVGYTDNGNDAIIDWTDRFGVPLGVPVFHLAYKRNGFRWGRSILEDIIPLQNMLNKAFVDVIAAADTTAFRLYWLTGGTLEDADGNALTIHPGSMIEIPNPEAKVGYFPGENLRPLIEVVDMFKVSIAQVSQMPLHLFQVSGQNASEGAQKQQEVAIINKAEKWGVEVGNFWEDVMEMAIRLSNTSASTRYPEDEIIQTLWGDMEIRDKTERKKDVATTAKTWTEAGADIEQAAIEAGVPEHRAKAIASTAVPIQDLMANPFMEQEDEDAQGA